MLAALCDSAQCSEAQVRLFCDTLRCRNHYIAGEIAVSLQVVLSNHNNHIHHLLQRLVSRMPALLYSGRLVETSLEQLALIHTAHYADADANACFEAIVVTLERFLSTFSQAISIVTRGSSVDLMLAALLRYAVVSADAY